MRLPNVESAIVSEEKIVGYLLNPAHPDGTAKAKFFTAVGFSADNWEMLGRALCTMAEAWPVTEMIETDHGTKYTVDGTIDTPNGKRADVRAVWIVDRVESFPRLVTAYPRKTQG